MTKSQIEGILVKNMEDRMFGYGDALYIQEGAICISRLKDWGWHYQDNEGHNFVFSLKKDGFEWKATVEGKNTGNVILTEVEPTLIHDYYPESVKCRVRYGNEKATHPLSCNQSHRISLQRYREDESHPVHLERNTGYYPSWLVPLLGSTSSGKSCWLYALRTMKVSTELRKLVPCAFNVDPTQSSVPLRLEATQVGKEHFVPVPILGEKNEIQAMVYFMDLAGEIGALEDRGRLQVNMQASIRSYASGLIVMKDINDLDGKPNIGNPTNLLLQMAASGGLPPRVCCVLTGADQICKNRELQERLLFTEKSPVFEALGSMKDSTITKEKRKDNMYMHMAIAADLLNRSGVNPLQEKVACFIVSSCTEITDSQGETSRKLDFSNAKNVELPAAYMLEWLVDMQALKKGRTGK